MMQSTKAEIYLLLVTACWGLTFPLLYQAVQHHASPAVLVFERFVLATCLLLPFLWRTLHKTTVFLLVGGITLGVISVGTYLFQTISLETINASRAAFLTGSSILLIPLLSPLFGLGYPKPIHFLSCFICLIGLYILTGANFHAFVAGDIWALSGAACVSLTILTVQWLTQRTQDYLLLTFYQLLFTALFSFFPLLHQSVSLFDLHITAWIATLFCAIFATAIGLFIQLRFQQYTTVTKVGLIFALEPVFASLFDGLLSHTMLASSTLIGGTIMIISIILPDILFLIKQQ